ncbi:MAG: NAD(P)-dependent oxidoreductase [bacterium]
MYLVTGGGGYLGSHLAKTLIERGERVRIFDVYRGPNVPAKAKFVKGDMLNPGDVARAMEGVEVVMHLAFIQSLSKRPLREKYLVNVRGTENFLKEALRRKVRRFVHTSTIEVYGTRPPFPCYEDAPKDNPTGWYGRHKWECERLCMKYRRRGLAVTMLRMPAICGPGHYNHGPFMDLMDRIIEHKPIAVAGNGRTYGNMTHYRDVIAGYLLASESEAAVGEAFNIASREPATHLEILSAMIDQVGSRSFVFHVPRRAAKTMIYVTNFLGMTSVPDHQIDYAFYHNHYAIDKARELLGFEPEHTVLDSAREQIESYRANREAVRARNRSY